LKLNLDKIGIIGSREHSMQSIESTRKIAESHTSNKSVMYSGLAKGIDSYAHKYAMEFKPKSSTAAIIGNGFNIIYPKDNKDIYNNIIESNGLIITPFSFYTNALPSNFIYRNKILAYIINKLIVIESRINSGTQNTVKYSSMYKKKIYTVISNDPFHDKGNESLHKKYNTTNLSIY